MIFYKTHNPKVAGSSPAPATKRKRINKTVLFFCMEEFVTYVLYSGAYNKIYIGFTSNLIARFYSHNYLGTKGYTLRYRPWKVVYVKFHKTKKEAMQHERYLKSGIGRNYIYQNILSRY